MAGASSDPVVPPGACVDRRYRLEGMRASGAGWSLWRGFDELLERPVAVQVFKPGQVRSAEVFEAVRRVSRITHGGLPRVFDANEAGVPPYLVSEWVDGRDLAGVLAEGPLDPHRVADVFCQVSAALAVAHDAGVGHLRLRPRSVAWSRSGHVKIFGLGIEAALARVEVDDPGWADVRDLGRLLRIALVGRGAMEGSRLARRRSLRAWRQCRHGVGRELAVIADRAVGGGDHPIRSVARLAEELRRVSSGIRRPMADPGFGVSEPIPGLVRVRTREDPLTVSTLPISPVLVAPGRPRLAA